MNMHTNKWIRKGLALAMIVAMLTGMLPVGALAESFSAKVAVSETKVYKQPDMTGESATITKGTEVTVQSYENGIAKISRNGYVGYVKIDDLSRTSVEESEEAMDETVVIKSPLRVYYKASTSAEYYDTPAGAEIVVLAEGSNGWLKLERKGVTAYAQKDQLQAAIEGKTQAQESVEEVEYQAVISLSAGTSTLNIRKTMSTKSKVLGKLKNGDVVDVLAIDSSWAKITANGVTGYVQSKYLADLPEDAVTPEPTIAPEKVNYQATIELSSNSSYLNIRKSKSTKAKSLGKLKNGAVVNVIEIDGSWAKITADGVTGYVQNKYLTDLPKAEVTPEPTVEATEEPQNALYQATIKLSSSSSTLNIRKSMSTSAKSLGKLKSGAEVSVLAVDGKWAKISANGVTGYVLTKYLVQVEQATPSPTPANDPIPCTVTADKLVVYKKASTKADVLDKLAKGDTINVLDVSGNWAMVEKGGNIGYALKGGLTPTDELEQEQPALAVKFTATVIGDSMTVYKTASTKAEALATVSLGQTVNVHEGGDKWAYISVNGMYGYAQIANMSARKQDTYKSGDSGSAVVKLNEQLLNLGYYDAIPGNSYDSATVNAVKRLQNALGLSETGEVDITLARVMKEGNPPSSPLLSGSMKKGDSGSNVQRLQTRLYALGYLSKSGSVDSDYGITTQTAVKLFQKAAGMSQDGVAGSSTLKKLYSVSAPTLPKGTNPADQLSSAADDPGATDTSLSASGQAKVEKIIEYAKSKLGCKYVYGAEGPTTFDCSGFTQTAFAQVGVKLSRSAYSVGYGAAGTEIAYAGLVRGDIVCFNTISDSDLSDHVGIYLGSGKFIHASSGKGQVVISDMSSGYYNRVFSWGKRFIF